MELEDLSGEEKQLVKTLRELNLKPKADSKEDLDRWLKEYSSASAVKVETMASPSIPPMSQPFPKISTFYGDTTVLKKGEVVYDQWKYEVLGLRTSGKWPEDILLQAMRKSVKGEASKVLMRLGNEITFGEVMKKFESVYGIIESKEHILANFYSARQMESEDITAWSCRLEDLLSRAIDQHLVDKAKANDMLKAMIFTGMRPELKNICGYVVEKIDNFDELRVALRVLEKEHLGEKHQTVTSHSGNVVEMQKEIDQLKGAMGEITSNLKTVTEQLKEVTATSNSGQLYRGNRQRGGSRGRSYSSRGRGNAQLGRSPQQQQENASKARNVSTGNVRGRGNYNQFLSGIFCYRCGQEGHYQYTCNIRTDHLN